MLNDYNGKLQFDARHQEFMKEAQGGWMLKDAPQPNQGKTPWRAGYQRIRLLLLAMAVASVAALLVAALIALRIA